jgi:hypothetical protein
LLARTISDVLLLSASNGVVVLRDAHGLIIETMKNVPSAPRTTKRHAITPQRT